MAYIINYTDEAENDLISLKKQGRFDKLKKIKMAVKKLINDPRHPGLHTTKYVSLRHQETKEIFQSYVENNTPGAFRIFWHYGPGKKEITIFAITPHP